MDPSDETFWIRAWALIGGMCFAYAIRMCLPIYFICLYTLNSKSNLPLSLDTNIIFSRECSKTSASKMHEKFNSCSMCYLHFWILQTLCFWQTITQVIYFLSFAVVRLEGCNVVSRVCFSSMLIYFQHSIYYNFHTKYSLNLLSIHTFYTACQL